MTSSQSDPLPKPEPLGAAGPLGERVASWGRTTTGLDPNSTPVTSRSPELERSPRMGEPSEPDLSTTRGESSTMRGESPAQRANRLARLREPGEWPTPAGPARRAQPGEMPRAALALRDAAVDPWRTSCWYAPSGAVPYTLERRAAGYLATAIAYVRFAHPDGRRAVGIWIADQLTEQKWPRRARQMVLGSARPARPRAPPHGP
jgi:hypothetical protein